MYANERLLDESRFEQRARLSHQVAIDFMREHQRVPKSAEVAKRVGCSPMSIRNWIGSMTRLLMGAGAELKLQLQGEVARYANRHSAEYTLEFLAKRLQDDDMVPLQVLAGHEIVRGKASNWVNDTIYELVVSLLDYYVYDGLLPKTTQTQFVAQVFVEDFVGRKNASNLKGKGRAYYRRLITAKQMPVAS
jgi:hypothetical protein